MHKKLLAELLPFCLLLSILPASLPAYATGINHSTLPISANVINVCLTVTATTMAFGNYTAAVTHANSTITVTCLTLLSTYTVELNAGTTAGAIFAQRLMTNGSATLKYNIYTSNAYAAIWGDGSSGTSVVPSSGLALTQNFTAFGQIPANQTQAPAGSYHDTITVTVVY